MTHPDTKRMMEQVEQLTRYCVSVDLISGIHEHARMISARPESPVHMIRVNTAQRSFADYIVAVQCGMLLILWSDPKKVPPWRWRQIPVLGLLPNGQACHR